MKKKIVVFIIFYVILAMIFALTFTPLKDVFLAKFPSGTRYQPFLDLAYDEKVGTMACSIVMIIGLTVTIFAIGTVNKPVVYSARIEEEKNEEVYQKTILRKNGKKTTAVIIEETSRKD